MWPDHAKVYYVHISRNIKKTRHYTCHAPNSVPNCFCRKLESHFCSRYQRCCSNSFCLWAKKSIALSTLGGPVFFSLFCFKRFPTKLYHASLKALNQQFFKIADRSRKIEVQENVECFRSDSKSVYFQNKSNR